VVRMPSVSAVLGDGVSVPVAVGPGTSLVEVSGSAGDGWSVVTEAGMADAGVPVSVDPGSLGNVKLIGTREGSFAVTVRALGPGGWSEKQSILLVVLSAGPPARPDPEALRREVTARIIAALGADGVNARRPGRSVDLEPEAPIDDAPKRDRDYSRLKLKPDLSGYPVDRSRMITTDRYITGVLEHRINSQVPGRLVAVVDKPVFGANGFKVLLESGTKIVCTYKPLEKEGQTRLQTDCTRAIRPDGASVAFRDLVTGDMSASAGLPGNVDNRTWERYGAAFISASIGALAAAGKQVVSNPLAQNSTQSFTDSLGQATSDILKRSIDLAPIISVPAGTLMTFQPLNDVVLVE
jgi:type IV secretion system protein VirB10